MRWVILALGLGMLGGRKMMLPDIDRPELHGETVTLSYVADPSVGYGQFRLRNTGDRVLKASVRSAWLDRGGRRQPLSGLTVFDLDRDQNVDPQNLRVDGQSSMTFLLGFPAVPYEPRSGESSGVGLELDVNGSGLQAVSPIEFVRRIPPDH